MIISFPKVIVVGLLSVCLGCGDGSIPESALAIGVEDSELICLPAGAPATPKVQGSRRLLTCSNDAVYDKDVVIGCPGGRSRTECCNGATQAQARSANAAYGGSVNGEFDFERKWAKRW